VLKFPQNHTIFEEKTNHKRSEDSANLRFDVPLWLNFFNVLMVLSPEKQVPLPWFGKAAYIDNFLLS
jgi:hypothetical protein